MKAIWVVLLVACLAGCSSFKALVAMTQSTEQFIALEEQPQIYYEGDQITFAREVAPYLSEAIAQVETRQYASFPITPTIYLPSSIDSFIEYCVSERSTACVIGNRLFVSPKLATTPKRIPSVLTHELSHLHLNNLMGTYAYNSKLPTWFTEGLAVLVSEGSGAENVSQSQAIQAILNGHHFEPLGEGSLLFRQTPSRYDLKPHMFYHQAALYLDWLKAQNIDQFKMMLIDIERQNTLKNAMLNSYGFTPQQGWTQFVNDLKTGATL